MSANNLTMAQHQETQQINALSLLPVVNPESITVNELRPWGSFTVLEEGNG